MAWQDKKNDKLVIVQEADVDNTEKTCTTNGLSTKSWGKVKKTKLINKHGEWNLGIVEIAVSANYILIAMETKKVEMLYNIWHGFSFRF